MVYAGLQEGAGECEWQHGLYPGGEGKGQCGGYHVHDLFTHECVVTLFAQTVH